MAYALRYEVSLYWVADGGGPGSTNHPRAQVRTFKQSSNVMIPGGDTLTLANIQAALSGTASVPTSPSMSADIATQMNNVLGTLQGWSTGGG